MRGWGEELTPSVSPTTNAPGTVPRPHPRRYRQNGRGAHFRRLAAATMAQHRARRKERCDWQKAQCCTTARKDNCAATARMRTPVPGTHPATPLIKLRQRRASLIKGRPLSAATDARRDLRIGWPPRNATTLRLAVKPDQAEKYIHRRVSHGRDLGSFDLGRRRFGLHRLASSHWPPALPSLGPGP